MGMELVYFVEISFSQTATFGTRSRFSPLGTFLFKTMGVETFELANLDHNNAMEIYFSNYNRNYRVDGTSWSLAGKNNELFELNLTKLYQGECR